MNSDSLKLTLIIDAPSVNLPKGLTNEELFSHFQIKAIELLKQESSVINHFGLIPDNGSDGIDDLLVDGTLFRFDVPQTNLGVTLDAHPFAVKQAFLTIVENFRPVYSTILEEQGDYKIEKTIVFDFGGL